MEQRYGILRAIAAIYQIGAVLALVGTLLLALTDSVFPVWAIVAAGLSSAIGAFAFGKLIEVVLAIEENTRKAAAPIESLP